MRAFFLTVLPTPAVDADQPITVFALQDRKSLQSIEPAEYQSKGHVQTYGFFLPTADTNYIALQVDIRLLHGYGGVFNGYTYSLLRKDLWMPLWLRTGIAEYYENSDLDGDQINFGQPNFSDIGYINTRLKLLPLQTLFTVDRNSPYYNDEKSASVFHAESWALVHYMETTDFQNKTHRFAELGRRLANGEDSATAMQHTYGELPQLDKRLQNYVAQAVYQGTEMRINFNIDDDSFTWRKVSTDEVNAMRADLLAHGRRYAEARSLAQSVLTNDPNNVRAHQVMGLLAAHDLDRVAARKWYDEAVELDPKDYIAAFYSALYARGDPTASASSEARLRQCIKLAPGFAPAYNNLADLYLNQHRNLDEAYMLTLHAVQLEPDVLVNRFTAAEVLVAQHNPGSALTVLEEAKAHVAKSPAQIAEIEKRIAKIKGDQASLPPANATAATSPAPQ
jgi:tetratricopeptide (TPR) repeat protein